MEIPEGLDGERVDAALARALGLSRTMVAAAAERGGIFVNGKRVDKSARLAAGDLIEIEIIQESARGVELDTADIPELHIVHSDEDILVIDKPLSGSSPIYWVERANCCWCFNRSGSFTLSPCAIGASRDCPSP